MLYILKKKKPHSGVILDKSPGDHKELFTVRNKITFV